MEEDNNMNIIEFQKGLESTPTPAPAPAPAPALVSVPVGASSFSEMNCNMELLMNNISEHLNQPLISSQLLDYFSTDSFLNHPNMSSSRQPHHHQHQHQQQSSLFCSNYDHQQQQQQQQQQQNDYYIQRHGKNVVGPSSPGFAGSESGADYKIDKFDGIGRKRKRKTEGKGEKLKEVIHVRAKRGQATDSHSLAERVRRERINEKLKVLQDLVPGCYKTMAMAAMLDVIINYVRSLQNQIEFLSMKLSAASMVYDFNSPEAEAFETLLRTTTNPYEAHEAQRPGREEYRGTIPRSHHTTWPF